MVSINSYNNSKRLAVGDLKDANGQPQEFTLTIERVYEEEMQDGTRLPVLKFMGAEKTFVLGAKINRNSLASFLGDETDAWVGRQCTLYPTTTEYNAEVVPCIRIKRPAQAAQPTPPAAPLPTTPPAPQAGPDDLDDSIPF